MRVLAIMFCLCLAGAAQGQDAWRQLADEGAAAGLDSERFDGLIGRCRTAGLSPESTREVTRGLLRACTNQLPIESVYAKIDEGLAKQAGAERISRAVDQRVEALEHAEDLLKIHRSDDSRGRPALIGAIAHALESGVPESGIAHLLAHPGAVRPGRLMGAIEGLEAMHAQDVPQAEARRLMAEALAQGLPRYEMMRAVDRTLRSLETDPGHSP